MAVRKAVGDNGRAQRVVKTLRRRGYRFVAAVVADGQPLRASRCPPRTRVSMRDGMTKSIALPNITAADRLTFALPAARLSASPVLSVNRRMSQ